MDRKELIEKARELLACGALSKEAADAIKRDFPELKESEDESEDERIRKGLIHHLKELREWKAGSMSPIKVKEHYDAWIAYLEKQKDASKAIETVDRIDKYIDEYLANAHDMKDSNPDKKYYLGWDDALGEMARILQDVYNEEKQKEQKPVEIYVENPNIQKLDPNVVVETRTDGTSSNVVNESLTYQPVEKRDYSGLSDLERTILRGFLCAGVENVPVGIIKETAKDCLAHLYAEWSEEYREEDIQTRFAFYTYKDDPSVLYLSNVFVEEASRNHGFGTRILKAAEKVAETIEAITICLKVKQDSPANAWYRKNGYGYVAFENGYDWLEKNLEYMKPNKPVEWSKNFEENIRILLHDKLTWHSEDGSMSSTVFIDDKTLKDIISGIWFYVGKEALKYSNKELNISEWSEEDERYRNAIINALNGWYNYLRLSPLTGLAPSAPFIDEERAKQIAWLKALRPQPHWKPSKEQMEALKEAIISISDTSLAETLMSLRVDLKKL